MSDKCGQACETYARVSGYMRPVSAWNLGKKQEFKDRVEYQQRNSGAHDTVVVVDGNGRMSNE